MGKKYKKINSSIAINTIPAHFTNQLENYYELRKNKVADDMVLIFGQDGGLHFGKEKGGPSNYIGKPQGDDGHILIVGGPGSWKTTAIVYPTFFTWKGHIVVIDIKPKSDLLAICKRAGKLTGKRTLVFNPMRENGYGIDPYAFIRSDGEHNLPRNAKDLALALLPSQAENREPVWIKTAQNLLTALIIYHVENNIEFNETLLVASSKSSKDLIEEIEESGSATAQLFIGKLKNLSKKTLACIDMELADLTIFAADSHIASALRAKEFPGVIDWNILNTSTTPLNIVLQIPEENLEVWAPLIKLLMNQLIRTLERRPNKYNSDSLPPVLLLLEEFARFGEIRETENAMATLRDRGVTFCLVVQSFWQLEKIYGSAGCGVIVDMCSYKAILSVTDGRSQKYFSDLIGSMPVINGGISTSRNPYNGELYNYGTNINLAREPIVYPHELAIAKEELWLLTPEGLCKVRKASYLTARDALFQHNENIRLQNERNKNGGNTNANT
jgi:type IV secretion system protein VirD4